MHFFQKILHFSAKIEKSTSNVLSPRVLRFFWAIDQPDRLRNGGEIKNWKKYFWKKIFFLKNRYFYDVIMQFQKFFHSQVELISEIQYILGMSRLAKKWGNVSQKAVISHLLKTYDLSSIFLNFDIFSRIFDPITCVIYLYLLNTH